MSPARRRGRRLRGEWSGTASAVRGRLHTSVDLRRCSGLTRGPSRDPVNRGAALRPYMNRGRRFERLSAHRCAFPAAACCPPIPTSRPERTRFYSRDRPVCLVLPSRACLPWKPCRSRSRIARERILDTAYELFSRRGVRDVGIDEVIERAGVAKATLYRHFPSKDELVIAFLELREERWTLGWVEAEASDAAPRPRSSCSRSSTLFDEWFHRDDFEACSFINVLLEMGPGHPRRPGVRPASREHPLGRARSRRGGRVCATRSPSRARGTSS